MLRGLAWGLALEAFFISFNILSDGQSPISLISCDQFFHITPTPDIPGPGRFHRAGQSIAPVGVHTRPVTVLPNTRNPSTGREYPDSYFSPPLGLTGATIPIRVGFTGTPQPYFKASINRTNITVNVVAST